MRSTVCLELENYSLDSHIPYLDKNYSVSWKDLDELMESFAISLERKTSLNNRKNILLICANFGKVTETWVRTHAIFLG